MTLSSPDCSTAIGCVAGIYLRGMSERDVDVGRQDFLAQLETLGLQRYIETEQGMDADGHFIVFRLRADLAARWAPDFDTLELCRKLDLDTQASADDLEREILAARAGAVLLSEPCRTRVIGTHPEKYRRGGAQDYAGLSYH